MSPRLVYLPPDPTDGVHRRNGGQAHEPEPERLGEHERPGIFQTVGGLLTALALVGAAVAVFALGVWKLVELVTRAI